MPESECCGNAKRSAGNDRDLTNFGDAFIRNALPGSGSVRAAFEAAQASIAVRERTEGAGGLQNSRPQRMTRPRSTFRYRGMLL